MGSKDIFQGLERRRRERRGRTDNRAFIVFRTATSPASDDGALRFGSGGRLLCGRVATSPESWHGSKSSTASCHISKQLLLANRGTLQSGTSQTEHIHVVFRPCRECRTPSSCNCVLLQHHTQLNCDIPSCNAPCIDLCVLRFDRRLVIRS